MVQAQRKLVFDIETASHEIESFDDTSRRLLKTRFRKYYGDEFDEEKLESQLTFSPLTSAIVAIGMLDAETEKGAVYFVDKSGKTTITEEGGIKFESGTESEILRKFWLVCENFEEFITFGGRTFDAPFLMIRSAIHGIRPSKNLMPNRYLESQPLNLRHIDLQDQLSFYSAKAERLGLHFWAKAFGIPSPKETGIVGEDITKLFRQGKSLEIAHYCLQDVKATLELYRRWEKYLKFV
ncbi:MAG: ribonuclease H-like domain-containing protein [Candidatus Paceibacteria bacterium]